MTDLFGLDEKLHGDLRVTKETARVQLGIRDLALVVNRYGELVSLDTDSSAPAKTLLSQRVQAERDYFKQLKKATVLATAGADGLETYPAAGEGGAMPADPSAGMDYQMMMQGGGANPNPIRKGGKGARGRGRGPMYPSGDAAGYPAP
jgi:hypothetical protein